MQLQTPSFGVAREQWDYHTHQKIFSAGDLDSLTYIWNGILLDRIVHATNPFGLNQGSTTQGLQGCQLRFRDGSPSHRRHFTLGVNASLVVAFDCIGNRLPDSCERSKAPQPSSSPCHLTPAAVSTTRPKRHMRPASFGYIILRVRV